MKILLIQLYDGGEVEPVYLLRLLYLSKVVSEYDV